MSIEHPTLPEPDRLLLDHTSEETAYLVDDYPYGFRLRCEIRYWIETNATHGDRLVSQTKNPKTDRWNKPKKSTYAKLGAMYLDAEDHVRWVQIGYGTAPESVRALLALIGGGNAAQQRQAAYLLAAAKVMEHVTYTVDTERHTRTDEENALADAEQATLSHKIGRAVAVVAEGIADDLANGKATP